MKKEINFGIGFITGRPNICNIINNYCKQIVEQVKDLEEQVNFTFFVLYDLNYLNTKEEEFYKINPEVLKKVKIKYLSPEYVIKEKEEVMKRHNLTEYQADLLIGKGYAKARNSILYEAVKEKIDYLLFWDDDEYPLAAIKDGKNIKWLKQNNILQHIKHIEEADITYGYRCGMINPLPYVEYSDIVTEEIYKQFIEALENEVISWNKVQYMFKDDSGIGYADKEIATYKKEVEEMKEIGKKNWVLGSGICLNLRHLEKIPAFYNPPEARGEDTFFSCALADTGAKVLRIPVYHFHDCFLKFTFLMKDKFPKRFRKVKSEDNGISLRFTRTTTGWTKYKSLLYYILDNKNYEGVIQEAKIKLKNSAEKVSTAFKDCDLKDLPNIYDVKIINYHHKTIPDGYPKENNEERWEKFNSFIKELTDYEEEVYICEEDLEKLDIDFWICGSDQIWNTEITRGFNKGFFLDFKTDGKKISYAVSMGIPELSKENEEDFKRCINQLDNISVREEILIKYTEKFTNKNVTKTLDPTLLLDEKDYDDMILENKYGEYILIYALGPDERLTQIARKIEKEKNVKIIELNDKRKENYFCEQVSDGGPKEFLTLIKNAKAIITNSFHGTIFSIIFKKEFYTITRLNRNSRNARPIN